MLPVLTSKTITWQGRRCLSHLCGCRRRKQDITTRREEQTLTVPTEYLVLLYFLPVAASASMPRLAGLPCQPSNGCVPGESPPARVRRATAGRAGPVESIMLP